jgi:IS5 family transposase
MPPSWLVTNSSIYFYGIKVQLITTANGIPVEFCIVPGGQADIKDLHQLPLSFQEGSELYADAAYTDYQIEDMLADQGIQLRSHRKENSRRKDAPWVAYLTKSHP